MTAKFSFEMPMFCLLLYKEKKNFLSRSVKAFKGNFQTGESIYGTAAWTFSNLRSGLKMFRSHDNVSMLNHDQALRLV